VVSVFSLVCISHQTTVRWPSWLWRQVKVLLTLFPGHVSGVGSSPTLINIVRSIERFTGNIFFAYLGILTHFLPCTSSLRTQRNASRQALYFQNFRRTIRLWSGKLAFGYSYYSWLVRLYSVRFSSYISLGVSLAFSSFAAPVSLISPRTPASHPGSRIRETVKDHIPPKVVTHQSLA
jgi:hypothetical protein